jgi:hypothetical protein
MSRFDPVICTSTFKNLEGSLSIKCRTNFLLIKLSRIVSIPCTDLYFPWYLHPKIDLKTRATPEHHRSEPTIVHTKHAGSNVDSRHSTDHDAVELSSVGSDSLSQSSSSITIVDDQSDGNASQILGHGINGLREQGKAIECTFPKK